MENRIRKAIELESIATQLFQNVAASLSSKSQSWQLMRDDSFSKRRDRIGNDIHLYLELLKGDYFHLRAYTREMMFHSGLVDSGMILLTAYRKPEIKLNGGKHSLRQGWYNCEPELVVQEILPQNQDIF